MSNDKVVNYRVEIEQVERVGQEIHVRACGVGSEESKFEPKWVQLRGGEYHLKWEAGNGIECLTPHGREARFSIEPGAGDDAWLRATLILENDVNEPAASLQLNLGEVRRTGERDPGAPKQQPFVDHPRPVQLTRTAHGSTRDLILWTVIRYSTESIKFPNFARFIDYVLCGDDDAIVEGEFIDADERGVFTTRKDAAKVYSDARKVIGERAVLSGSKLLTGMDGYRALRDATDLFLKINVGIQPNASDFARIEADLISRVGSGLEGPNGSGASSLQAAWRAYTRNVNRVRLLPYMKIIRERLADVPVRGENEGFFACAGLLREKLEQPCFIELIWSYWQEEGMLVQTINTIAQRFQNRRVAGNVRDPLANLELDPLRPVNNLLWGWVQDEQSRLSVLRRAHEYEHHYGMRLEGRALNQFRPADRRTKFIEAFHNFLQRCHIFNDADDDTTVIADGFPVLNALKEVHYLLAHGAHNQFGDLPSTARSEMLVQQWLLGRPEMREFLGGRVMVPYPEPWMDRVDAMKALQGWGDTGVVHFNDLATFGEQIMLGIRYGAWSRINDPAPAANFARYWRAEIQGYVHAYRAVTGIDLATTVTTQQGATDRNLPPSVHLMRRIAQGRRV